MNETIVSLPEMVDLALGTPEVGMVNFNVLHAMLHIIVNHLELADLKVAFRGSDSHRIKSVMSEAVIAPSTQLTEYSVMSIPSKDKRTRKEVETETNKITEKMGKERDDGMEKKDLEKKTSGSKKKRVAGDGENMMSVDSDKRIRSRRASQISQESFMKLESKVDLLAIQLQSMDPITLPEDADLLEAARSKAKGTPVNDVWQQVNLVKRVQAAELAIGKVTTLVETVAKESRSVQQMMDKLSEGGVEFPSCIKHGMKLRGGQEVATEPKSEVPPADATMGQDVISTLVKEQSVLRTEVDILNAKVQQFQDITRSIPYEAIDSNITQMQDLNKKLSSTLMNAEAPKLVSVRLDALEGQIEEHLSQLTGVLKLTGSLVDGMEQRLAGIETELGIINENLNVSSQADRKPDRRSGDSMTDALPESNVNAMMADMINKLEVLAEELGTVTIVSNMLAEEKERTLTQLEALTEQVETLKEMKVDRLEIKEVLAEKADTDQMNRKVSLGQFDTAYGDLTKGIEDNIQKLLDQEALWTQTLEELQSNMLKKFDKEEVPLLREFFNEKLKAIQDKLKQMMEEKKDIEAAGAKKRLMRNINCISCDRDVVMRMNNEIQMNAAYDPMPATRNLRPYITYELDQIRQQQKNLPSGRNMFHFEELQRAQGRKPNKIDEEKENVHLCTRHCGGSHTRTTAAQRVGRVGCGGPQAIPLANPLPMPQAISRHK